VLPARESSDPVSALRSALDRLDVPGRLLHIRDFVWRGGELRFQADPRHGAYYLLSAEWPAAALDRTRPLADAAIESLAHPLVDGRWIRRTTGYELRVGIDLAVPSALGIRSAQFSSHVPVVGRLLGEVEDGLQRELAAYVDRFLSHCASVPEAAAADRDRLRQLGLD
jgi:hypothetical protein